MRRSALGVTVLFLVLGAGLWLLNSMAPLQLPTTLIYLGLAILLAGILSVVLPSRWVGLRRRTSGVWLALAGVVLAGAGLLWPVDRMRARLEGKQLDLFLPEFNFDEEQSLVIRAAPATVLQALHQVTFDDIGVLHTLVTLKHMLRGQLPTGKPGFTSLPILAVMAHPRSGFFPLKTTESEMVIGMAGKPWSRSSRGTRLTPEEFLQWDKPGTVKIAFDFLVEDAGNGSTRLSTETRVLTRDDFSRRLMAICWRLVYPGSGLVRHGMLEAVARRAEIH